MAEPKDMDTMTALVSMAGKQAAEEAKGLLQKLLGPAAEEMGLILKENVRVYRLRNQLRLLKRAQELLKEAGQEPHAVPLRILLPLLDGASIEDDAILSDKWAALLASAATDAGNAVLASFPGILGQLSPPDVAVLDVLYEPKRGTGNAPQGDVPSKRVGGVRYVDQEELLKRLSTTAPETIEAALDNLIGLGLVEREPTLTMTMDAFRIPTGGKGVRLSTLGGRFVAACSDPVDRAAKKNR